MDKSKPLLRFAIRAAFLFPRLNGIFFPEQKGNAPYSSDGYQRVDNAADYRTLSAKDPSHHVEA